jgi:hypothetical protein
VTSAQVAAKAAKADAKWDSLATAYSGEVDVFTAGQSLVPHYFAHTLTYEESAQLDLLSKRAIGYESTIRAECRKATA